jgi:hypothetical protein
MASVVRKSKLPFAETMATRIPKARKRVEKKREIDHKLQRLLSSRFR